MNWLILTITAIFSRAGYGVLTKVMSIQVKTSSTTQAVLLMTTGTILAFILAPFFGGIQPKLLMPVWGIAGLMVLSSAIGNLTYFKGVSHLESSTAQIVFSSILLWSAILSWSFLNTRFSVWQLAGVLVLLAAILLAQYQGRSLKLGSGAFWVLVSAACFAVFQVLSAKLAVTVNPGTYLVLSYLGPAAVIFMLYPKTIVRDLRENRRQLGNLILVISFTAAASLTYFVLSYLAYQVAPNSGIVVILLTSQVVVAVILSIIFLRERSGIPRKLTAGLLALLAGILIKS
jgi:drug/metabolite transporter (DMT)-like permease